MNVTYERTQKLLMRLLAYLPRRLPETPAEHALWASEILEIGEFPQNDSFRHAIATQVLHLDSSVLRKSQMYFVNTIRRSIVNQTSFQVIQETKGERASEKTL